MPIPETEPHVQGLLATVRDNTPGALQVGLTRAPEGYDTPYAVLYPDPGNAAIAQLCGTKSRLWLYIMVHAVGRGPEQSLWTLDKVRNALFNNRPVVDGRKVFPITQQGSPEPVRRDTNVEPALYLSVCEFLLWSDPA